MEEEVIVVEEEKYRFKQRKCSCGFDLRDKVSNITSLYRNVKPMGACPKCGLEIILDASPESSNVVLDYEPTPEPEVEASTSSSLEGEKTMPIQPKRSHHKKVK